MQEQTIQAIAEMMGLDNTAPNGGWVSVTCPFAQWEHKSGRDNHPSMRVEVRSGGISRWRCFSCSSGGDLTTVLFQLKAKGYEAPYKELMAVAVSEEDALEFPSLAVGPEVDFAVPESWLDSFRKAWIIGEARDYFIKRGIMLEEMMAWDVRWDGGRRRVCFPIRDKMGVLRGLQGRMIDDVDPDADETPPRYLLYKIAGHARGATHWLGESMIDWDKPVVTVEGSFDAASVRRVYPNVVAGCGAGTVLLRKAKLERLAPAIEIVTLFDPGEAGDRARFEMRRWCRGMRVCKDAILPPDTDPGDSTPQELWKVLSPYIDSSLMRV